jgi:DNA-binding Xre family transcriptional regulator
LDKICRVLDCQPGDILEYMEISSKEYRHNKDNK